MASFDDDPRTLPTDALVGLEEPLPTHPELHLQEHLAQGGMGAVHLAWDAALQREVAAKHLLPTWHGNDRLRQRFVDEARLAASLEHPHILPVHSLGERDDLGPFFTMKRVDGHTLQDHLKEVAPRLEGEVLDQIVAMLVKVCEALALAHDQGVAHCDLKASNVMLGRFGEVYLADWGSAVRFPGRPRRDAEGRPIILGTPSMMAPEQARGAEITGQTDVFGMGALLYYILARRAPFRDKDSQVSLRLASTCTFTPLSESAPRTPRALRDIATRALAAEPSERHGSITQLRDELDRYVRGRLSVPTRLISEGAVLIEEGEESDHAYVVVKGRFAIYKSSEDGMDELIREVGPGDVVGEAGVLSHGRRTATVQALTPAVVQVISAERLDDELVRLPDWLRTLVQTLAERFHERETR